MTPFQTLEGAAVNLDRLDQGMVLGMDLRHSEWMDAVEAAAHLGVSRPTLYAYVSRGRLRAHTVAGERARRYRRSDVERLAVTHAAARQPRRVAGQALDWGLPVLASSLTLISNGRFHYRGQDAVQLADTASLEDVAALLWQAARETAFDQPPSAVPAAVRAACRKLSTLQLPHRLIHAWATVWAAQLAAFNGEPRVRQAGALLQLMALAATGGSGSARGPLRPLHQQLTHAWGLPDEAADGLRRALVLCADHELNASSFAVRCVAATGAQLGDCISAGLAALSGPRHGGMTARVEALWPRIAGPQETASSQRRWITQEVERQQHQQQDRPRGAGGLIPGFGHPLYPNGDPRATALLAELPRDRRRDRFVALVQAITGEPPALDFALVALRRSLGAPDGAAFTLFALARTVGWLAHALEQQDSGALIRPRAAYLGPAPAAASTVVAPPGRVIRQR